MFNMSARFFRISEPLSCRRLFLCLLTILVTLALPFSSTFGKTGALDVVLAIDTSGSMKKTDPNNLRSEASKLFISLLDEGSRVALVMFDTKATTLAPLQELETDRKAMKEQLNHIPSEGKWTDLNQAVRHSYEILLDSTRKERAIIVMTDGKMDLGNGKLDQGATYELLKVLVPEIRKKKIKIFTIAFTRSSDVAFLKLIALKTKGFFYLTEKDKDIHITYTDIYNHMVTPETLPMEGDKFFVDLSVKEMNIVVTKEDPETEVSLLVPGESAMSFNKHPSDVRWSKSAVYEMVTIPKPMVGTWYVKYGAEKGNKVFISTDLKLMTSMKKNIIMPGTEMYVEIWLQDGPESEERSAALFHELQLTAELIPAKAGEAIQVLLNDDGMKRDVKAGDGIYTALLAPTMSGEYTFRVHSKTATFEREKETSFYVPSQETDDMEELVEAAKDDPPEEEATPEPLPEEEKMPEGINWGWVLIRFILINVILLALLAGGLFYKKYVHKRRKSK